MNVYNSFNNMDMDSGNLNAKSGNLNAGNLKALSDPQGLTPFVNDAGTVITSGMGDYITVDTFDITDNHIISSVQGNCTVLYFYKND